MGNTEETKGGTIDVLMLGNFELRCGDSKLEAVHYRSHQIWGFLQYLIVFRNKNVSRDELIELLWPGKKAAESLNAMKNLVYRARIMLQQAGIPGAQELIISKNGSYRWNPARDTVLDCEEMERLFRRAEGPQADEAQRLNDYRRAVKLYQGEFLAGSGNESWSTPLVDYYKGIYVRSVQQLAALLKKRGRQDELMELLRCALKIDCFEESFHKAMIEVLLAQKKRRQAMAHYEYIENLFQKEKNMDMPKLVRELHYSILHDLDQGQSELETIKAQLEDDSRQQGAFVCEYEIFKNIYRIQARLVPRRKKGVFLGLFTLQSSREEGGKREKTEEDVPKQLRLIQSALRRGDVLARFGQGQYVVLLFELEEKDVDQVTSRVLDNLNIEYPMQRFSVSIRKVK